MKLLLIGGNGFLGSNFIQEIDRNSYSIVNIYHDSEINIEGIEEFNIYDLDSIEGRKFDLVINFASKISVHDATQHPFNVVSENIKVSNDVVNLCRIIEFRRFIYISTDRAISLDRRLLDPYGFSKKISQELFFYLCNLRGIKAESVILPNIYGPNQKSKQLIPTILNQLFSGETTVYLSSFQGGRNYLHVKDASYALEKIINFNNNGQNIYYFSGEYIEIIKLIKLIKKSFNHYFKKDIEFIEKKDRMRSVFSEPPNSLNDKTTRELVDWAPQMDFENSIDLIIKNKYEELRSN